MALLDGAEKLSARTARTRSAALKRRRRNSMMSAQREAGAVERSTRGEGRKSSATEPSLQRRPVRLINGKGPRAAASRRNDEAQAPCCNGAASLMPRRAIIPFDAKTCQSTQSAARPTLNCRSKRHSWGWRSIALHRRSEDSSARWPLWRLCGHETDMMKSA